MILLGTQNIHTNMRHDKTALIAKTYPVYNEYTLRDKQKSINFQRSH